MIRLILTVEDEKGRRFAYAAKESPLLIGRSAAADLRLGEPSVALFHARVTFDEMHATVEDLASPSGSTKNGRRLEAGKPVSILDDTPVVLAGGFRLTASWGEVDDARPEVNPFAVGPARDADAEIAALSPAAAVARAERLSGRGTGDGKGRIGFGGGAAASANGGKTLFMAAAPRFELPKVATAKQAGTGETAATANAPLPSGAASPRQTPSLAMKLAPAWTPSSPRKTPSLAAKLAPPWVPSARPATPSLPVAAAAPSAAGEVIERSRRLSPSPGVPAPATREASDKITPASPAPKERAATPGNGNGKSGNDRSGAESDASLRKTRIGRMASGTDSGPTAAPVNRSPTGTTPASGVVTVGGPDSGRVTESGPAKVNGTSASIDPRLAGAPTLLGAPALQFPLPGRGPSAPAPTKAGATPVTGTPAGAGSMASEGSRPATAQKPAAEPVAEAKPAPASAPADPAQAAARDPQSLSALAKPVERLERRSRDPHVDGADEARRQTRLLIVVFLVTLVTVFGVGAWLVQRP